MWQDKEAQNVLYISVVLIQFHLKPTDTKVNNN